MLHKRPTVIVHTMVFIDEKLAQVSRRHVGWDLHHLSHPILAEDFYDLKYMGQKKSDILDMMLRLNWNNSKKKYCMEKHIYIMGNFTASQD